MRDNQWYPRLEEYADEWDIKSQLEICREYARAFINHNTRADNIKDIDKFVYRLLKKFMYDPSKEEAMLYGRMRFCDDTTNENGGSLATPLNIREYLEFSSVKSVIKRLYGKTKRNGKPALLQFWLAGSAALSEKSQLPMLMKIDALLLNLIRCVYHSLKTIICPGFP
jgi:hypothetical protein